MVILRAASRKDALSVSQVHVSSWRSTYQGIIPTEFLNDLNAEHRAPRWQQVIDSGCHLIVADMANEIVGFVSGGPIREPLEGYDAELYAIYLLDNIQGNGIGTALLIEMAKRLCEGGFRSMIVWVLKANDSLRFYQKTGAVLIAEKDIEIGGALLPAAAYGWPAIQALANLDPPNPSQ